MANSFRPPKQWVLQERETITSFASWQSNILYHLSLCNEFAAFLDSNAAWQKKSTANRGLVNDADPVPADQRKTAAQKNIQLERMLGIIAQFAPSLLRNDIINKSTSLDWIWKRIRKHYSFQQSEVNFLRLANIHREADERYETLFQRIIAHLEDNLLTTDSGIQHDGANVTVNEELTPTCERIAVYLWLTLIDQRLPGYVSRVYSHDLQRMSLKDIQPQICDSMDSLLAEINNQEDIQIKYSRTSYKNNNASKGFSYFNRNDGGSRPKQSSERKECVVCKAAGRASLGHTISQCWHVSKADKLQIAKALQVFVECGEDEPEDNENQDESVCHQLEVQTPTIAVSSEEVRRVKCSISPYFFAFYMHHTVKIIVDTGATSTLISATFAKRVGINIQPTNHSARQLDKTKISVAGEVKFTVSYGKLELHVEGLVNDSLDCDILAGVPFCTDNNVDVLLSKSLISIGDGLKQPPTLIAYGSKPSSIQHDVYRVESDVLRNGSQKVLLPGEFLELEGGNIHSYEGEVAIEPRVSSPMAGEWPPCSITRVINGTVRIPNNTNEPIHLHKAMHVAQIRRVTSPNPMPIEEIHHPAPKVSTASLPFSSSISLDPSGELMTESQRKQFAELHVKYDRQFRPDISLYNGYSGNIKAYIDMGPSPPPQGKPKLPFYNQGNLRLLQDEADSLESIGVMVKPEKIGVKVRHASPSFLVRKPSGEHRLVTAFNELGQYVRYPPSVSITCDDVLRRLASWKYIIKSDMKKAYYQIPMAKSSMQWLGTHTPFGGLRVYTRPVMGMPGSAEFLQELLTRVFGEYTRKGFVIIIADDMNICGNTIGELYRNWEIVLRCCELNNLTLSPSKTIVCPVSVVILGWVWRMGTITVGSHKTSPLAVVDPPKTCSSMRSFIGAYKAISRCIPKYSSLMSPLEDSIKGMQGSQHILWTDELRAHFKRAQDALKSPAVLTIPTPSDKLILTVDASPVNNGIGSTLFVVRDGQRLLGEFFSVKLKCHQVGWQPCELEALAISTGVHHFAPYIRESEHALQVLTDSKPCAQAFSRLCKGKFSASSRVSTFLSTLSEHNVTVQHLKGKGNTSSDFSSRNPSECCDPSCQICAFVQETAESVVNRVSVEDVLSGTVGVPFYNKMAWKSAQQNCAALRKAHTYLVNGTRPARKVKHIADVRRYLEVGSLNAQGLIVVRKSDPYMPQRELIVVPADVLSGLLTALHLYLNHATAHQLKKVFDRYFFGLNTQQSIQSVVDNCSQCTALKQVPKEMFTQSSTPSPEAPGQAFAADIFKRTKQCIHAIRDIHSSYTVASIIPDETADSLRTALLTSTSSIRTPLCTVRVDSAPGFKTLKNDQRLVAQGITLDFGRVKNINKNPVAEKCNQELEVELLRIEPSGGPISEVVLQNAVHTLNSRVRNRGLSAREILFCRDQFTSAQLKIDDGVFRERQHNIRQQNHSPSARSKSNSAAPAAAPANIRVGSLVYLKKEGDKTKARESYIVMKVNGNIATIHKFNHSGKFMSTPYEVPLEELLLAVKCQPLTPALSMEDCSSSDDEDDPSYGQNLVAPTPAIDDPQQCSGSDTDDEPVPAAEEEPAVPALAVAIPTPLRRSDRQRREPNWLSSEIWDRE